MRIAMTWKRHALWVLMLIGVSGCGLSEYQTRADEQAARVRAFDEINRLLDDPLEPPPRMTYEKINEETRLKEKAEKAAWPFDVYLRLPKGFGVTPKEKDPHGHPFACFRYASAADASTSIFVAADWIQLPKKDGEKKDGEKKEAEEEKGVTPAFLQKWVAYAMQDYFTKTQKGTLVNLPDKLEPKPREVKILAAYPNPTALNIIFKTFELNVKGPGKDLPVLEVYIREDAGRQACVIVQRSAQPANLIALTKSIEACLGTLDISRDAGPKRAVYKKAKSP
ncbi:MAG: hypothetical protein HY289_01705 [Planctomycetes bacterium]|nr:hypothetical protein [Planctomycetota bacterium]